MYIEQFWNLQALDGDRVGFLVVLEEIRETKDMSSVVNDIFDLKLLCLVSQIDIFLGEYLIKKQLLLYPVSPSTSLSILKGTS